ncbi:hypothetical protein VHEMI03979 [[Torrubiella] hemipterigena]|uniref:C2H2 type master regulator of conidiophore development brlA n=1 Tax=[Torrubiella] hemipterigena TaxID=1531966 RepID=A0A0A1T006_9HYPO|nr:hypothetical protein VHEMI03979 [[Torrubiella] hemipterigena]
MEGSHDGAYNGASAQDIMNIALNFDGIMSQDIALPGELDAFSTAIHDDSCLDHNGYSHCANGKGHMNPPPKPTASQRQPARTRQRHSISNPAPSQSAVFTPSWDSIFTDSLLSQSNACAGIEACNDVDCASVSCPSDCGAGPCSVDCADDVCCESGHCAPSDLCLDGNCHGAATSCTKPACGLSENEAAAAATLTSFGENLMAAPTITTSAPTDSVFANMGLPAVPCSSLSMDGPLADGLAGITDQIWGIPPEFILANHIMQYHDPAHQTSHVDHNCIAGNPSSVVAMCSLPKMGPDSPLHEGICGFPVHDPQSFAQHIFQQHRPALMQHGSYLKKEEGNNSHNHGAPSFPYNSGHQLSASASPNTNLSMGTSVSPTPVSLATPSPMDGQHYFLDLNTAKKEPVTTTGVDSQYMCRWTGPNGQICGRICGGHKELQEHCKTEHLKEIKKDHAGFYCQWQGCTRQTTFSQRSKLERHMQVHTGFKPVECKICGAQLSAKQSLEQHMRTHTGEKPWVCSFPGCNQAFKQQSALTMHERTHTGSKPLSCDICGKKFGESSNLSKHRRIHNIRGSHVCGICGKDFHRLDQLRRHMGTNHKDRPEEVKKLLSRVKTGRVTKIPSVMSAASSDVASEMTEDRMTVDMQL